MEEKSYTENNKNLIKERPRMQTKIKHYLKYRKSIDSF